MSDSNWWVTFLAAAASGVVSYFITRMSKTYDARGAAEAALIGTGPTIIAEQNKRIQSIQEDNSRLWRQIEEGHERERKCQEEINALQAQVTDQRHEIRDLQTKVRALEYQLGILKDGGK